MARTPANVAGHPIHPMLIPFPIGLWVFSLAADVVFRTRGSSPWQEIAFFSMLAGVAGALLAAVPGFVDYVAIVRSPRASRSRIPGIATVHMSLNLVIVALYVVNLYLRTQLPPAATTPFWLSVAAILLLLVSGWLGGSLVYVHRVAVEEAPGTATAGVAPGAIELEAGTTRRHTR